MSGRPGDASLAQLIKEHGAEWVIEHTGVSTAWVAVRRDDLRIVGAHDVGGLKYDQNEALELLGQPLHRGRCHASPVF